MGGYEEHFSPGIQDHLELQASYSGSHFEMQNTHTVWGGFPREISVKYWAFMKSEGDAPGQVLTQ